VALGDTHVTHDPVAGQGANAASRAAWLFGELLLDRLRQGGALDQAFCAHAEQRLWDMLQPIAQFSNALLQEPPPHAMSLFAGAARSRAVADTFVTSFAHPEVIWAAMSSPEGAERFLTSVA
jgi:2-polyprenyl-6-methoxyphenol hydroxylase-like FAD-dependent oxidoreductase